jgi:hypothetical protein
VHNRYEPSPYSKYDPGSADLGWLDPQTGVYHAKNARSVELMLKYAPSVLGFKMTVPQFARAVMDIRNEETGELSHNVLCCCVMICDKHGYERC